MIIGLVVICIGVLRRTSRRSCPRGTWSPSPSSPRPIGIIALGIVLVLLLGEIDLSVGSVSGFAAAMHGRAGGQPGRRRSSVAMLAGIGCRRRRSGSFYGRALHQGRRAELRVLAGRPAGLPGRRCSTCSATRARSTCPSDSCLLEFARVQVPHRRAVLRPRGRDRGGRTSVAQPGRHPPPQGRRASTPPCVAAGAGQGGAARRSGWASSTYYLEHRPRLSATCGRCSSPLVVV